MKSEGAVNLPGISKTDPKKFPLPRKPAVTLQPQTYHDLWNGTNQIINAIRPTLGPLPRLVAMEKFKGKEQPEFLDDGATIARRIIQVRPRGADVGAMIVRQALWKMHQEVGDGSTTMGVIYQSLLQEGIRAVTQFGCNPMLLREGLEKGLQPVLACLRQEATPLLGKDAIARIARGMCQEDFELAEMLGEIFDITGADGMIIVEGGNRWGLEREYIEGTYWDLSGWFSRHLVSDQVEMRTVFEDASIFISNLTLTDPGPWVPVLEKCVKGGIKKLVVVAKEVSDGVIGLLVNNNAAKTIESVAVRIPRIQEMDQVAAMEDIATLTGGKIFQAAASARLDDFQVEDLGFARRAWATESLFGIYGGKGDPRLIRQHINQLRHSLKEVREFGIYDEAHWQVEVQKRIARMVGGTAILRVGGLTETERETRKEIANRAVAGLRHAVRSGVVPGGGTALLNAQSVLAAIHPQGEEEPVALKILARALEEPMRAIASNAGAQPDVVIEKMKSAPQGTGFDARTGRIVDMRQAGILDSLLVLEKALQIAVHSAAMALTTDVIIHHKWPKESVEP
jgi:chaperonin GroEL